MCPKNIRDYEINKILIIGLSCLGDNLLLTPAIKLIKDTFKKAEIDIVIGPRALDFAKDNHWFSDYFVYNKKKFLRFVKRLRKKRYDLIVDFRNSLIPFFLRGKFKLTFFFREMTSDKLYTHESERILKFLKPYFGTTGEVHLYFPLSNVEREKTDNMLKFLKIKRSDILIILNSGANFLPKRWKKERFAEVAKALIKNFNAKIMIIGTKQERKLAEEVKNLIGNKEVFNMAGRTTVSELASLIERADLMITNDTGPMHIASAVNCPVVAIFGPGNPYRYGPIGTKNYVVHAEIECFPCRLEAKCKKDFICMDKVSVNQVLKSATLILDEGKQLYLFDL